MALQLTDNFRVAKIAMRILLYVSVLLAIIAGIWMHRESNASAMSGELDGTSFITTWDTVGSYGVPSDASVTIPTRSNEYAYSYNIDWNNDGIFDEFGVTGDATHDYGTPGTYTVRIQGDFPAIVMQGNASNTRKIREVNQWGTGQWRSMEGAFYYAQDLNIVATDIPNLSLVSNMSGMFHKVTISSDISAWDVSNVTNMSQLFSETGELTSDISNWDVGSVTDMSNMFRQVRIENVDLSSWDVSSVKNMHGMFAWGSLVSDISSWDVSSVEDMGYMFDLSSFNGDISAWDVSSVTNMNSLFRQNSFFNGDISSWDVSSVTDMSNMFWLATAFNGDLSLWNVSNVRDMGRMFREANVSNLDITSWNMANVESMEDMFYLSTITTEQYDALLTAWASQPVLRRVLFTGTPVCYSGAASARDELFYEKQWMISDEGRCPGWTKGISSVTFDEVGGRKYMTVIGDGLFSEESSVLTEFSYLFPHVSLNNTALPVCIDKAPFTLQQLEELIIPFEEMYGYSLNVSESAPCFRTLEVTDDGYQFLASPSKLIIWLPNDFDITKSGTIVTRDLNMEKFENENIVEMITNIEHTFNGSSVPVTPTLPSGLIVDGGSIDNTPAISNRPTFTGTATPGATVTVTVHSDPVSCTTTADQNGNWSCTLPSDLVAGAHNVYVTVVNLDASVQEFGPYAVTVDGVAAGVIDNNTPGIPNTGFLAENIAAIKQLNAKSQTVVVSSFALAGAMAALIAGAVALCGRKFAHSSNKMNRK